MGRLSYIITVSIPEDGKEIVQSQKRSLLICVVELKVRRCLLLTFWRDLSLLSLPVGSNLLLRASRLLMSPSITSTYSKGAAILAQVMRNLQCLLLCNTAATTPEHECKGVVSQFPNAIC